MGFLEENGNTEIYKHLTKPDSNKINQKWTLYLALCCVTVCMGSFQFGYNIGSLNLVEPEVVDYIDKVYWGGLFYAKLPELQAGIEKLNSGIEEYNNGTDKIKYGDSKLREVDRKRAEYLDIQANGNASAKAEADRKKAEKEKEIRDKHNMTVEQYLEEQKGKFEEGKQKLTDGKVKIDFGLAMLDAGKEKVVSGRKKLHYLNTVLWGFINSLVSHSILFFERNF